MWGIIAIILLCLALLIAGIKIFTKNDSSSLVDMARNRASKLKDCCFRALGA